MHPSAHIRASKGTGLLNKKIVLGVTGSIAAIETIKLARELIRFGADVYPVMTPAATEIIHPYALEFAAGNSPIIELSGQVEHVALCGQHEGHADLFLIAPCTANTISKIAMGIDDTPVTTFATTAIGTGIPILIAPAMHGSMYEHPVVIKNMKLLEELGVQFIAPVLEEYKAKFADLETVLQFVLQAVTEATLQNTRVLIIGGSTAEAIDDMRVLTNKSSGRSAIALANTAFRRGANVDLWYGLSGSPLPVYINTRRFQTVADLVELTEESNDTYEIIICCAAISDYTMTVMEGKIPSGQDELILKLHRTPKVIEHLRKKWPNGILVGYKAESRIEVDQLINCAKERLHAVPTEIMVANLLTDVRLHSNRVFVITNDNQPMEIKGTKDQIAEIIFETISKVRSNSS